ncbi:hypothetical protein ACROAG_09545 [Shewanella oncorhynchi]|uniref:hypothetical protein n=1 Tax=Shewanella TaxID=22 RepID=UPI0021D7F7A3|nr:hypothetical protein [Shewanella sp. SM87]MCU8010224.1 hypothetical protein [Shewanella sp. SM87]
MEARVRPTTKVDTALAIALKGEFQLQAYVDEHTIKIMAVGSEVSDELEVINRDDGAIWNVIQSCFAVWVQHFILQGAYPVKKGALPIPASRVDARVSVNPPESKHVPDNTWVCEAGTSEPFTLVNNNGKVSALTLYNCDSITISTGLLAWFLTQDLFTSAVFEETRAGYLLLRVGSEGQEPACLALTTNKNERKAIAARCMYLLRHFPSKEIRTPLMGPLPQNSDITKIPFAFELLDDAIEQPRTILVNGSKTPVLPNNCAANVAYALAGLKKSSIDTVDYHISNAVLLRWKLTTEQSNEN